MVTVTLSAAATAVAACLSGLLCRWTSETQVTEDDTPFAVLLRSDARHAEALIISPTNRGWALFWAETDRPLCEADTLLDLIAHVLTHQETGCGTLQEEGRAFALLAH